VGAQRIPLEQALQLITNLQRQKSYDNSVV